MSITVFVLRVFIFAARQENVVELAVGGGVCFVPSVCNPSGLFGVAGEIAVNFEAVHVIGVGGLVAHIETAIQIDAAALLAGGHVVVVHFALAHHLHHGRAYIFAFSLIADVDATACFRSEVFVDLAFSFGTDFALRS